MTHTDVTTKTTPGPWHIAAGSTDNFELEVRNDEYVVALVTDIGNDVQQANARFIVTACNNFHAMLEALRDIETASAEALVRRLARAIIAQIEEGCELCRRDDCRQCACECHNEVEEG